MPSSFLPASISETDDPSDSIESELSAIDGGCVFKQVGQALLAALVIQFQQPTSDARCVTWTRLGYA